MNNDPLLGYQFGSYQLIEVLGRGSFAQVYRGRHIHLGTSVAVKVLHGQLEEQEKQDFQKEATLLTRLKHNNIIRFMDYGFIGGRPYLITDLAEKGSLNRIHPRGTCLPVQLVAEYVTQIAEGLDFAHSNHVIHRDIKPENILVSDTGALLLADFGIAKSLGTSHSYLTNRVAGTFAYIAPEQLDGRPTPASDQYALGVMVYEWLTGRFPFEGTTQELIKHHLQDAPPLLRYFNPTISPDVESVVLMTLKKEPTERFRNVRAFANALRQAAGSSPQQQASRPTNPTPSVRVNAAIPIPPIRSSQPDKPSGVQGQPVASPPVDVSSDPGGRGQPPITKLPPVNSDEWQKLMSARQTLPFKVLPSLPQAHLTDFWWPTFIITQEDRRKINQGTILSEVLSELDPLTSFPSLSVALPVSSIAKPVSIGTLDLVKPLSEGINVSSPLTPPPPPPIIPPTKPSPGRSAGPVSTQAQPGPSQPGGSASRTAPAAKAGGQSVSAAGGSSRVQTIVVIAILTLFIGSICVIGGSSGHALSAVFASWILLVISSIANIMGLSNITPSQRALRGWLIFLLILSIFLLICSFSVYGSVSTWCSQYGCP